MEEKYINGFCNYTGGKFKLLPQLLPEFDYTKNTFVDLFAGSLVISANVVDKYEFIIANDIIEELIGIHREVINNFTEFVNKVKNLVVTKEDQDGFNILRKSFNENKSPEKLFSLMLCSTNNMLRFNKSFLYNQTFGRRTYNPSTEKKLIEFYEHILPFKNKICLISKNFTEVEIPVNSMTYIDCPYSNSEAGYNSYWPKNADIQLYKYIREIDKNNNSFVLSGCLTHDGEESILLKNLINDGFLYKELICDYNKVSRKGNKETTEIIIKNF